MRFGQELTWGVPLPRSSTPPRGTGRRSDSPFRSPTTFSTSRERRRYGGKGGGGDATRGKATYPALVGLDKAKGEAQRLVQEALDAIASFSRQADPLREIARFIVSRKA